MQDFRAFLKYRHKNFEWTYDKISNTYITFKLL